MRYHALALGFVSSVLLAGLAWAQEPGAQTVQAVNFRGLERVSEQLVRSKVEIKTGAALDQGAIARDIRRLYELGFFTQIQADASPMAGGVAVTYVVQEKQVIDTIRFAGNKKLKARRIQGAISQREGGSFVAEAFDEDRQAILDLYEAKGYANTQVDLVVDQVSPSRVRLTYHITEGKKARIRSITFEGNDVLSDHKLRKTMKTKRRLWFLGGKFEESKFENDLRTIIETYGNVGHLEADIARTDVLYTDNGKGMDITIQMDEGAEYRVDVLDVANNAVYDDDEVLEVIEVHAGDVHNKGQVAKDAELVAKGLQDSGYVDAEVNPQVTLDREAKTTHVIQNVHEGQLKYVKEVKITGNEVTRDEVIRRQMLIEPGDRYDGGALKDSRRNLENTRYFDLVRTPLEAPAAGEEDYWTNVLVDVEEGKTGTFNFGAGYSTEEGIAGFGELRLNNFDITNWPTFSGGGQKLELKLSIGETRDEYRIGFTEPEFLGYPVSVGVDLFDESYQVTGGADYQEDQRGAQLRLGKVLSPYVTVRSSYRYEKTDISELPFFVNQEIRQQRGETTTYSQWYDIERNTLDRFRDPSAGSRHVLSMELAGLFGGDNHFVKLQHDSIWYYSIDEAQKWVLSFRTREGWATDFGDSDYIPLQDRFYAGGTTTVRGYDNRDIGPKVKEYIFWGDDFAIGGTSRLVTNLEMKYKVTPELRLYSFFDAGGVWEDSDFNLGDMKCSVGLGIGFDIPRMGPIRVDYGIPINPDDDQGSGRLHMATGLSF